MAEEVQGRIIAIFARAIGGCWWTFKWTVALAVVVGAVAAVCLYRRVDEEIRRRVETRIARQYPGLKVCVRAAQRIEGRGIQLRDLSIAEPGAAAGAELLHVEELLVECPTGWQQLLTEKVEARRVTIRRPTLRVRRQPDGQWNAGQLFRPTQDAVPPCVVEDGTIEIRDAARPAARPLLLRDVNLTLTPAPGAVSAASSCVVQLCGGLRGDGLGEAHFEGQVDLRTATCALHGRAQNLEISPEVFDTLPAPLATRAAALGDLRAHGDLQFAVAYDPAAIRPVTFDISGRLLRGRLDDTRLPHELSDISATVRINNDGLTITDLSARSGQATLRLECRYGGFEPGSPLRLSAQVGRLELDGALWKVLPETLQTQWNKYLPSGQVDAGVKLDYDGHAWRPEATLRCLSVSFASQKFPYRLERGEGNITWKHDALTLDMRAFAGSRPVHLAAVVAHPFSAATGWLEAWGEDIQLDEALIAALPESHRQLVRSLDPRGRADLYWRAWRDQPQEEPHRRLLLRLNQCWLRYDKFPYWLADVCGRLEMIDGAWTFRDIRGAHNSAAVTATGRLTPGPAGDELVLNLAARDVPLEEELCNALGPNIRELWRDLRPRGAADLSAEVRYLPERKQFSVAVRAQPQRDSASIEPLLFPYRLDHLQGTLVYRDGRATLEHFKAEHGAVKVAAEGTCDFLLDGQYFMHWDKLSIDRLRADRELIQALPERLRKVVVELRPSGPVNIRGALEVTGAAVPAAPLQWRWNLVLGVQHGGLQLAGVALDNVCGELSLDGLFDGQRLRTRGNLAFDSLNYKDCQFTQVTGPISIDGDQVLFGSRVDRPQGVAAAGQADSPVRAPRSIVASLFGGRVFTDGWATLGRDPRYAITATLMEGDLARCAQEVTNGRQRVRGKIVATADLTGHGWSRNALAGRGMIRVSDADVYELPVMVSLLKILSIRLPDQHAFSDATMSYRVEDEHIYFDRIDFRGDAISLRGKGELDFQSAIRLTFYALVGRGDWEVPVLKQVFHGASQQLMLIHVNGTLQDPHTSQETLPALNHALQQIRDELNGK